MPRYVIVRDRGHWEHYVNGAGRSRSPQLTITTNSLPEGTVGSSLREDAEYAGGNWGTPPYAWTLIFSTRVCHCLSKCVE